ncbi:MAG: TonB-dependent receptor [Bryobacterales bacterium]|nr:TonB-dependent receptor [Bryobacterales bacterium]
MSRICRAGTVAFLISAGVVSAQTNRGAIRGTITDPTGAAVANVEAKARNQGTSIVTVSATDPSGAYTFPNLLPGDYELTFTSKGFKKSVIDSVALHVGETLRVDSTLVLGELTESVSVSGGNVAVTPDTVQVGTVLTSKEYDNLPLAAVSRIRVATDFALFTPGVLGSQQRPGEANTATTQLSVDGSKPGSTDVTVDGMSAGQFQNFGSFTEVGTPVDGIAEFNIIKGTVSAEYGHIQSALISFSLKSGTNEFHASLFENFRNTRLNARSFFEAKKLPFHQNNFGGTVTGPIRKDKTFFMTSLDLSYFRGASQVVVYTSPTAEFLKGDFSQLRTSAGALRPIYDPGTSVPDGRGGVTRQPFQGNVIPAARISPITRQVADLYPLPNRSGIDNNFVGRGGAADLNNYYWISRIDHRFNDKHSVSGSYNFTFVPRDTYDNPYEGTVLLNGLVQDFRSRNFRVTYDYTIRPTILNHFQIGYNRFLNPVRTYSHQFTPEVNWVQKLGVKGVSNGDGSLPVFAFSSDSYPQAASPRWDADVEDNSMLTNTTTLIRGRHSVKIGFDARMQEFNTRNQRNQNGTFVFDFKETALNASTQTGNSFASFLLGQVDSANLNLPLNVGSRRPYFAWFVQDDFKFSSRLTLNLGLRYDLELPPYELADRASIFDLKAANPGAGGIPGAMVFSGTGQNRIGRRAFEDKSYGAIGPRLGVAYKVGNGTVVRSSYGIMYSSSRLLNSYLGYGGTQSFISADNGNTPAFRIEQGMPTDFPRPPFINPTVGNGNNVTTSVFSEAARMPMSQVWRFDVQRELAGGVVAEAAYVGTRATHLNDSSLRNFNQVDSRYLSLGSLLTADINSAAARAANIPIPYATFRGTVRQALRAYPQVLTVTSNEDKLGSSTYHAFETKVQKRFANGLQYLASYTFSKSMTDVNDALSGINESAIQDAGNRRAERAVAAFDTPQNFWISTIYEPPVGRGKRFLSQAGPLQSVLGDWAISVVLNYQSGVPLRISQSNRLSIFNSGQRPDRVAGAAARSPVEYGAFDPAVDRLFNPAAFVQAGTAAFGNAASRLSDARGFGIRREDVNVSKKFHIMERFLFEFNGQIFNLFNRNQWGRAEDNISSSNFGKVSLAGPGRFVQLGLKMRF